MDENSAKATIYSSGDDLFVAVTPGQSALALDTSHAARAPNPMELLMIALGTCTAVDVISILRKKREAVTDYHVEVTADRRDEHPRSFTRMRVRHLIRGRKVSRNSVSRAIELSDTKYCSVAATLRPTVQITSDYEITEEDGAGEPGG